MKKSLLIPTLLTFCLGCLIFAAPGYAESLITQTPEPPTFTPSPTATVHGGYHYLTVNSLPFCSDDPVIQVTGSTVPYSNVDVWVTDIESSAERHYYQWTNDSSFNIEVELYDETFNGITVRSCGDVYPPPCTTISYLSRPDLIVSTYSCSTTTPAPTLTTTPSATSTPIISPTPSPSISSPTPPPSSTPSVYPSWTPDEPTATPTAAPCDLPGVSLMMPAHEFHAGDPCWMDVIVCNPTEETWESLRLLVILEVYGQFFFAPSWSTDLDYLDEAFPPGLTTIRLFEFPWPAGMGETPWFRFYAGLCTEDMTALIGEIGLWEFRGI